MPKGVTLIFTTVVLLVGLTAFRLSRHSYPDKKGLLVRGLCSVTFAAAAAEFILILCEVLQAGDGPVRAHLWKASTALLLFLLVLVVPAVQIARYFFVKHPRLKIMALPVYVVYLVLFRIASIQLPIERYVPPAHQALLKSRNQIELTKWFTIRQDALACISFIGITTMAFLCGISSVSAPYSAFFGDRKEVTEVDSEKLRQSLRSIDEMLVAKQLDISRLRLDIARDHTSGTGSLATSTSGSAATSGNTTPKRAGSTFSLSRLVAGITNYGNSRQAQLQSLLVEQDALISLRCEIEADLISVCERLNQQQYYKTLLGKLHRLVFAFFAIYCVYRVCNSYIRMVWWLFTNQPHENAHGPRDAIVLIIASAIDSVLSDLKIGVTGWSRIIGVLMSGCVFFAALNGVLRMALRLMRVLHKTPSSNALVQSDSSSGDQAPAQKKITIPLDPLLVAQVVGVYILSIATTLRFSLPSSMSGPIMAALVAPLKVTSVQIWNDMVLGATSTVTLLVIFTMNRLSSDTIYDDEKGEVC